MRPDVSALYVDPRGPYPKLVADWWDEKRDARLYAGPNPVVAHPPCGPWSCLSHFSKRQAAELGPLAVSQVRRWGGVLEHPAHSKLWRFLRLPFPNEFDDGYGGYTCAVDQVEWGHPAKKATWLYIVGVPVSDVYESVKRWTRYQRKPTHVVSTSRRRSGALPPMSWRKRHFSPPAFAEWLIELASQAKPVARSA